MPKIKLRRGFKTEANCWSRDLRSDMGILSHDPLCPWALADFLEVPVFQSSDFADKINFSSFAPRKGSIPFSAATIFNNYAAFIIHNSQVSLKRQASDIAHELAHLLLRHNPAEICWKEGGTHYHDVSEEEAKWLGPALLISDEAALYIAEQSISVPEASNLFKATEDVVRMRLNVTGAYVRAARRAAKA
jgi:Zn-dependent peptidase ImmA (M78 family)